MDDVRKIRKGDDLLKFFDRGDFRAGWNTLVEIAYWWKQYKERREDRVEDLFAHPAVIDVANTTGADLPRFGVVQLAGPMLSPATSLLSFQQGANFLGVAPANPPDTSRFAVMLEPVKAIPASSGSGSGSGSAQAALYGRAVVTGAVACLVNVTDVTHGFAVPVAGIVSYLASSPFGGAVILSQPAATGLQWCQVLLGACCAANFAVASGSGSGSGSGSAGCCPVTQWCTSFPGVTNGLCPGCATLTQPITLTGGDCSWVWGSALCLPTSSVYTYIRLYQVGSLFTLWITDGQAMGNDTYYHGSAPPGYSCTTPLTLDLGANNYAGYCHNFPAALTLTPGACGGGSGGGGGGGGVSSLALGHAAAGGSPANVTLPSVAVAAGTLLIVNVAWAESTTAGPTTVAATFAGRPLHVALSKKVTATTANVGAEQLYLAVATTATTGDIVVTAGNGSTGPATDLAIAAVQVSGLTYRTPNDYSGSANTSAAGSTSPDAGVPPASTNPDLYVQATIATLGPSTDADGAWQNGYTDGGQDGGTTAVRLCEGYKIGASGDASKTGITARPWAAVGQAYW